MSFDAIPEDKEWSTSCPQCKSGSVTANKDGNFECDECDFIYRQIKIIEREK